MHFENNYTHEDLRELLELPAEGNFEVVIEGKLVGRTYSSPEVGEDYDEDLEITAIKHQQIPDEWYESLDETFLPLDAPGEG
jgi:hypothetical protein